MNVKPRARVPRTLRQALSLVALKKALHRKPTTTPAATEPESKTPDKR